MAKQPTNYGKAWSGNDIKELERLQKQNTPTPLLAYRLGRTEVAVRTKAHEMDLSLKPVNRSPYNREKGRSR